MTANIQAHSFCKGFSTGLVPLTREAIVPYLVAVSLPLARMCSTVTFILIKGFQYTVLVTVTREAIVPYFVAVSLH